MGENNQRSFLQLGWLLCGSDFHITAFDKENKEYILLLSPSLESITFLAGHLQCRSFIIIMLLNCEYVKGCALVKSPSACSREVILASHKRHLQNGVKCLLWKWDVALVLIFYFFCLFAWKRHRLNGTFDIASAERRYKYRTASILHPGHDVCSLHISAK